MRDFPKLKALPTIEFHDDPQRIRDTLARATATHTDLKAVYSMGSGNAIMLEALRESTAGLDLVVVAHDLTPVTRSRRWWTGKSMRSSHRMSVILQGAHCAFCGRSVDDAGIYEVAGTDPYRDRHAGKIYTERASFCAPPFSLKFNKYKKLPFHSAYGNCISIEKRKTYVSFDVDLTYVCQIGLPGTWRSAAVRQGAGVRSFREEISDENCETSRGDRFYGGKRGSACLRRRQTN